VCKLNRAAEGVLGSDSRACAGEGGRAARSGPPSVLSSVCPERVCLPPPISAYLCLSAYLCQSLPVSLCVHVYGCTHTHTHTHTHAHTHIRYMYTNAHMHTRAYVRTWAWAQDAAHAHKLQACCADAHVHTRICRCNLCACAFTHTCMPLQLVRMRMYTHVYAAATCAHAHVHTRTCIRMNRAAHTCTYTYLFMHVHGMPRTWESAYMCACCSARDSCASTHSQAYAFVRVHTLASICTHCTYKCILHIQNAHTMQVLTRMCKLKTFANSRHSAHSLHARVQPQDALHTRMHTLCPHMHTHAHTCTHMHTHAHTCAHAYIHMHDERK